jgi:hypothetical protein
MANLDHSGRQHPSTRPGNVLAMLPRTREKTLFVSAALTVLCFLIHIFFLLLVNPWRVLDLSKETAYLLSGIPLGFGAMFFGLSVYSFIKIEERSAVHILVLLVAISLGSMCIQGLLGLGLHYLMPSLGLLFISRQPL